MSSGCALVADLSSKKFLSRSVDAEWYSQTAEVLPSTYHNKTITSACGG